MTKGSEKIAIAFLAICAAFGAIYVSHAADTSIIDALGATSATFGSDMVVTGITSTQAQITFPLLVKNGETIMNYELSYSTKSLLDNVELTDIKKVVYSNGLFDAKDGKATLTLTGLSANTTYYFVIMPVNKEGGPLTPSDQKTFTTLSTDGTTGTPTITTDPVLGSADTAAANFTYQISGNNVTVLWKAIDGASKFTFATKESTGTTYTNVGSELVSKEKFSFIIPKVGLYSVKIVPVDANGNSVGAEKILTVKVTTTATTPGKGTPATGPALNLVLMSTFLLMLVYVVYRFRTTK